MRSREQIFDSISSMMQELFEVPAEDIKLESRLYDDLELDSIDAVDLIVGLQDYVGQRLQPEQFKEVRTVSDVIDAAEDILKKVEASGEASAQGQSSTEES